MVVSLLWIDAPRSLEIAIERMRDRPAALVEVSGRAGEFYFVGMGRAGTKHLRFEFAQVQVAVFGAAGTFHRQRIVCEELQPYRREMTQLHRSSHGDGISFWRLPARENRA